jgi:hypothetical protein
VRPFLFLFGAAVFLTAPPARACMPDAVHFELGSIRLNTEDRRAIAELATAFQRMPRGSRLWLTASTDGTGSPDANVRLARRRGEAVRAAFVRLGIPAEAIQIETRVAVTGGANGGLRYVQIDFTAGGCG